MQNDTFTIHGYITDKKYINGLLHLKFTKYGAISTFPVYVYDERLAKLIDDKADSKDYVAISGVITSVSGDLKLIAKQISTLWEGQD